MNQHGLNSTTKLGLVNPSQQWTRSSETRLERAPLNREKKKPNRFYTSYSKFTEMKLVTIGIADPLRILQWAEKTLPNGKIYGEVLNANTLHHKTFKPQKGGLFCERIFGPLKDFTCACGKVNKSVKQTTKTSLRENETLGSGSLRSGISPTDEQKQKNGFYEVGFPLGASSFSQVKEAKIRKFCPECDVEYTWSVIRRYQLGYIKLASPVTHVWFFKGTPSYLSILLDIKRRDLQSIIYCSSTITLEHSLSTNSFSPTVGLLFPSLRKSVGSTSSGISINTPSQIYEIWKQSFSDKTLPKAGLYPTSSPPNPLNLLAAPRLGDGRSSLRDELPQMLMGDLAGPVSPTQSTGQRKLDLVKTPLTRQIRYLLARRASKQTLNKNKRGFNFSGKDPKNPPSDFSNIEPSSFLLSNLNLNKTDSGFSLTPNKDLDGFLPKRDSFNVLPFLCSLQDSLMFHSLRDSFSSGTLRSSSNFSSFSSLAPLGASAPSGGRARFAGALALKIFVNNLQASPHAAATPLLTPPSLARGSSPLRGERAEEVSEIDKTIFFVQFYKNLPVDFYIFSRLSRKVYKKTLMFSFFKLWQKMEKKAYYKAMYKAFSYFYKKTSGYTPLQGAKSEANSFFLKKLISVRREFQKEKSFHYFTLQTALRSESSDFTSSVDGSVLYGLEMSNFQSLFHFYQKNILITLQHLKQPILSLYNALITKRMRVSSPPFGGYPNRAYTKIPAVGTIITKMSLVLVDSPFLSKTFILSLLYRHFLRCFLIDIFYTSDGYSITQMNGPDSLSTVKGKGGLSKETTSTSLKVKNRVVDSGNQGSEFDRYWLCEKSSYAPQNKSGLNKRTPDLFLKMSNRLLSFLERSRLRRISHLEKEKLHRVDSSALRDYALGEGRSSQTSFYLFNTLKNTVDEKTKRKGNSTQKPLGLYDVLSPPNKVASARDVAVGEPLLGGIKGREKKGQVASKPQTLKKGLYNHFYTVSHREFWGERGRVGERQEKDWQFFLIYSYEPPQATDLPIFVYKPFVGLSNGTGTQRSELSHTNLDVSSSLLKPMGGEGTEMKEISNAFFSGPGILYQLLSEFNSLEIRNFDKQNRLILYYLKKSIFFLKKQLKRKLQPLGDGNEMENSVFLRTRYTNRRLNKKLQQEIKELRKEIKDLCKKRVLFNRRTKLVRKLFRKRSNPANMILTVLPVLPPDLRPIVKMGSQIAASDLNRLYQRIIYRNDRLKKFLKDPATSSSYEMKYSQRLLQEAVENLISNGKGGGTAEKDARGRALKSLSDILKGKQGRFRQFLLGKRVDYSGRSVIVVGPKLKLHECGIPIEMALELYLPFLLKVILNQKYARTVVGAKALIHTNRALVIELLRDIMQVSPVLLNRAPTLHRLGFQAFIPRLVEGRAILLHPLVCSAFNADFDGDQMAVHVPITIEARAEAWKCMLSRNNLLSPATGDPLAIPSQDMVLGCYFLTTFPNKGRNPTTKEKSIPNGSLTKLNLLSTAPELRNSLIRPGGSNTPMGIKRNIGLFYNELSHVLFAYNQKIIDLHSPVWVKWSGLIENGTDQEEPIEIRCSDSGHWQEFTHHYIRFYSSFSGSPVAGSMGQKRESQYMKTTPGRILFHSVIESTK